MVTDYIINAKNKDLLTKFLSLEEQKQFKNKKVKFSNLGYERKRAYLFHDQEFDDIDFKITVIKLSYNKKFYALTHSQILGALMSLGIVRDCIGDIYVNDEIYILVISEMAPFIINNLTKVSKAKVETMIVDNKILSEVIVDNYIETTIIVSSLRLDVIASSITNLSREKVKEYIALKNIKVNGVINTNIDYVLKPDDLISIHRFGRTIIKEVVKKTKKDKYVLLINKTK